MSFTKSFANSLLGKIVLTTAIMSGSVQLVGCGNVVNEDGTDSGLLAINVSNRRPITEVASAPAAGQYARSNSYYGYSTNMLRAGMKVLFSASYGANGGEAGQARGVLVAGDNGGLFYKQETNTTTQLLLAPGLPFRTNGGSAGTSLWNLSEYVDLVNRVSFAEQSRAGATTDVYSQVGAYKVDFDGGTAGRQVRYSDAMELTLQKKNRDSVSNVSIYFAQQIGAVALEFRETGAVGGTFKLYIGDKLPQSGGNLALLPSRP